MSVPASLERRHRVSQALYSVVMKALLDEDTPEGRGKILSTTFLPQ